MINKGYFKNAVIDTRLGEIVVGKILTYQPTPINFIAVESKNVNCQNCGAQNTIFGGKVGEWEYCSSPLK